MSKNSPETQQKPTENSPPPVRCSGCKVKKAIHLFGYRLDGITPYKSCILCRARRKRVAVRKSAPTPPLFKIADRIEPSESDSDHYDPLASDSDSEFY